MVDDGSETSLDYLAGLYPAVLYLPDVITTTPISRFVSLRSKYNYTVMMTFRRVAEIVPRRLTCVDNILDCVHHSLPICIRYRLEPDVIYTDCLNGEDVVVAKRR